LRLPARPSLRVKMRWNGLWIKQFRNAARSKTPRKTK